MDLAVGDEDVQEESINLSEGVGRDWGTLGDLWECGSHICLLQILASEEALGPKGIRISWQNLFIHATVVSCVSYTAGATTWITASISPMLILCRHGSKAVVCINSAVLPTAVCSVLLLFPFHWGHSGEQDAPVRATAQEQPVQKWDAGCGVWMEAPWRHLFPLPVLRDTAVRRSITPVSPFSKCLSDSHLHVTLF